MSEQLFWSQNFHLLIQKRRRSGRRERLWETGFLCSCVQSNTFPCVMQWGTWCSTAITQSSRLARKLLAVFGLFLFLQPLNEKFNQIQLIAGTFHSAACIWSCFAVSPPRMMRLSMLVNMIPFNSATAWYSEAQKIVQQRLFPDEKRPLFHNVVWVLQALLPFLCAS